MIEHLPAEFIPRQMRVVFDLDGTLANDQARKHHIEKDPKDWDAYFEACHTDTPNMVVVQLLHALANHGHIIEIWSGRSCGPMMARWRQKTVKWLSHCATIGVETYPYYERSAAKDRERPCFLSIPFPPEDLTMVRRLRMRGYHDRTQDTKLKEEWLEEARATDQAPDLVIEDRTRVVEMWRSHGIRCIQVAQNDF